VKTSTFSDTWKGARWRSCVRWSRGDKV